MVGLVHRVGFVGNRVGLVYRVGFVSRAGGRVGLVSRVGLVGNRIGLVYRVGDRAGPEDKHTFADMGAQMRVVPDCCNRTMVVVVGRKAGISTGFAPVVVCRLGAVAGVCNNTYPAHNNSSHNQ